MKTYAPKIAALVALLTITLAGSGQQADNAATPKKTAKLAHFRLHGDLDESPVAADPIFGTAGENFKAKLERIKKAAKDPDVQGLIIHLDGVTGGWAKVEELRKAIAGARKAGKKVFAYLEDGSARDYLIACEADIVAMPPSGSIMLVGIRAEIQFFKDLLERLGIRADFLQMGVFKAAAEPYTRNKMSPEAKSQFKLVIDDFYENVLVSSISRSRKLSPARVMEIIDQGPFTAGKSKNLGLIDRLEYSDEFREWIKKDLGVEELKVVNDYGQEKAKDLDLSNPFAIFKLLAPQKTTGGTGKKDRIAIIYAVGVINTGKSAGGLFGGNSVGSTTMIEAIRQADADPKVKAIVLRVDSPGGSALASDLIWKELKQCKKPIIASMSDTAASGGYYISMGAKKVYAQPGTLTGSIGVVGGKIALRGLMEKVGVNTEAISRGANSGLLSSVDGFSISERKAMEAIMEEIYDQFLNKVIDGRKSAGKTFAREQLLKLAEGRIWTGRQALEHGLVDALGGLDDAIADAKGLGGLAANADVDYLVLPRPSSFLDSLMDKGFGIELKTLLTAQPELRDALRQIEPMLRNRRETIWMMSPVATRFRN